MLSHLNKYVCFIRKNSPYIREKLEHLGYSPFDISESRNKEAPTLVAWNNGANAIYFGEEYIDAVTKALTYDMVFTDCGEDEALFFAIVAKQIKNK